MTQYINIINGWQIELPKCSPLLLGIISLEIFPVSIMTFSRDNFHSSIALIFFFPIRLKSVGEEEPNIYQYFTPKSA